MNNECNALCPGSIATFSLCAGSLALALNHLVIAWRTCTEKLALRTAKFAAGNTLAQMTCSENLRREPCAENLGGELAHRKDFLSAIFWAHPPSNNHGSRHVVVMLEKGSWFSSWLEGGHP